jgi:hypothetical protein
MKSQIVRLLWDKLWQDYRARVSYAETYQQMIAQAGGTVANDHIAFRSLRLVIDTPSGKKNLGIEYLAGIAEALGYSAAGEYFFSEQKLYARHYQHPDRERFDLPKLFISELIVDELPEAIASLIYQTVSCAQILDVEALLNKLVGNAHPTDEFTVLNKLVGNAHPTNEMVEKLQGVFTRPWLPPKQSVVEAVNKVTQYGAWVLLHGYSVNHFTGYINRQNTSQYPDIESTASGLASLGVPMKAEIEGSREIGLLQTATHAVTEMVSVLDDFSGEEIRIPWTYAYYEIAERCLIEVAPGKQQLFEAFLGQNAQHLFEMTRKAD